MSRKQYLKPCPFCGNDTTLVIANCRKLEDCEGFRECVDEPYLSVVCDKTNGGCGASGGYAKDKAGAIVNWNERNDLA